MDIISGMQLRLSEPIVQCLWFGKWVSFMANSVSWFHLCKSQIGEAKIRYDVLQLEVNKFADKKK